VYDISNTDLWFLLWFEICRKHTYTYICYARDELSQVVERHQQWQWIVHVQRRWVFAVFSRLCWPRRRLTDDCHRSTQLPVCLIYLSSPLAFSPPRVISQNTLNSGPIFAVFLNSGVTRDSRVTPGLPLLISKPGIHWQPGLSTPSHPRLSTSTDTAIIGQIVTYCTSDGASAVSESVQR